ncbi:MAG TPA: DNA mismatch repair protein MutS [Microscillaceae bacterium]|nr:DNA mismatch repair protein MutS [Microscillaceae bacterium]
MMKQYNSFKAKYPGALLLFRVGDFYETFGEDAITASKILGITLTKRHNGAASEIELAGFPHHALDAYLPKLVRAGQRVAICDQIEDPRFTKKLVKRGVTELVTPGVSYNDSVLEVNRNNYLASLSMAAKGEVFGVAFLDISTGEFFTAEGDFEYIDKLLQSFNPSEILFSKSRRQQFTEFFGDDYNAFFLEEWFFTYNFGNDLLNKHFKTKSLKGFGIADLPEGIAAAGAILHYLTETHHNNIQHISSIGRIEAHRYVWLDKFTIRNLELLFPQQENGISLIQVLDNTVTPMGARLLRKWVALPLKDRQRIEERLSMVEAVLQDNDLLEEISQHLKQAGDVERLISKVASRRIKPRELLQVKKGLAQVSSLKVILENHSLPQFQKFANQLNECQFLAEKIEKELLDEPKNVLNEGGLIKPKVNEELDELHEIVYNSKQYLEKVRQNAVEETGIQSLKLDYNKVFGFYLEVTNKYKTQVPKEWIRKQTLVNAERYITEELKIYEDKIVHAEERIWELENDIYKELVIQAGDFTNPIQQNARILATLDCLASFAFIARKYNYVKPTVNDGKGIQIKAGRHPVIERQLPADEPYIPNNTFLDDEEQQIMVITGPNMSGKSALLRQVALITLMAQIGSFVPADAADIGIVDKIFTRVGASDNIAKGESTFMVEMMETASIMNNLSERSLVLMDEIGRGTSTYDGISIAWAILEYLHDYRKGRPKTLFATHYHELNELAKDFPRIKNFHVTVKEVGNKVVFMRKIAEGGSEHSFGIHVARMAGMPRQIVLRADDIMHHLEANRSQNPDQDPTHESGKRPGKDTDTAATKTIPKAEVQMSIFEAQDPTAAKIQEAIRKLDVNTMTPVEALLKLNELKGMMNGQR